MNVYEIITQRMIEKLEAGTIPWKQPWKHYLSGESPCNIKSKKPYRGVNVWLLQGAPSPYWGSYKQWSELGGQVRKGEKGTPVIFWQTSSYAKTKESGETETKTGLILKYYTVFNHSQVDGIEEPKPQFPQREVRPIEECSKLLNSIRQGNRGPANGIRNGESRAYYSPSEDRINMPLLESFRDDEHYHSVLFHELIHSTGHKDRLNRDTLVGNHSFGSKAYSKEELVAEMGAAFLCGSTGILPATLDDSASYLKNWIDALKGDSKLLIQASSQAQKAAEYLLGVERKEEQSA